MLINENVETHRERLERYFRVILIYINQSLVENLSLVSHLPVLYLFWGQNLVLVFVKFEKTSLVINSIQGQ
jgi:hypothetical protein